jgi:hypothetical protein
VFWFHYPSGGMRHKATAVRMKRFGAMRGVSDLYFRWPRYGLWPTGWIEIKARDGRVSDHQKAFLSRMVSFGDRTAVCRSLMEVIATLKEWGVPMRANTASRASRRRLGRRIAHPRAKAGRR